MPTFEIPAPLQKFTNGQKKFTTSAVVLRQALHELENHYPQLKQKILSESGEILRYVSIFVGPDEVKYLKGLDTKLNEQQAVSIFIALAGG